MSVFEIQCYEVAVRHKVGIQVDDLMLRVMRQDLDAVLRTLAASGVEAFHVRRIPLMSEMPGLMEQAAGLTKASKDKQEGA